MVNSQISFSTTTANQNIFTVPAIKTAIMDLQNFTTDADYNARFTPSIYTGEIKGFTMYFDIIVGSTNTISVNGKPSNGFISNKAYSSVTTDKVYDITIGTPTSGIFIFNIRA